MRTYSRRGRLPREETQSCGDVGAAKNTAAPARMIFRPRTAGRRGLPHDYLPRRQPGRKGNYSKIFQDVLKRNTVVVFIFVSKSYKTSNELL